MASEARERTYVPHTEILERCEIIQKCINAAELFKGHISFTYKPIAQNKLSGFSIVFYLNDTTYASALYRTERGAQHLNNTYINNIESSLGHYTGTFLLNMHLIMCYLSDISDITLDNVTRQPARAAKGIYKRLEVNQRKNPRNAFRGKNLTDQLLVSEGAMRLKMHPDLIKLIQSDLLEISTSERVTSQNEANPWNPNCEANMTDFFRLLKENFSSLGGSIKKRSTRKRRNTRRRSIKKRT
jgi:hypothetical protein